MSAGRLILYQEAGANPRVWSRETDHAVLMHDNVHYVKWLLSSSILRTAGD